MDAVSGHLVLRGLGLHHGSLVVADLGHGLADRSQACQRYRDRRSGDGSPGGLARRLEGHRLSAGSGLDFRSPVDGLLLAAEIRLVCGSSDSSINDVFLELFAESIPVMTRLFQ